MSIKINRKVFYYSLIGLHILGFIKQVLFPNLMTLDSDDYILLAKNIFEHGLPYSGLLPLNIDLDAIPNKGLFASRPIGYSVFIYLSSFGNCFLLLLLAMQNVLSIGSIYFIEKIFIFKNIKLNYTIALICLIFFPTLWIYSNWIMAETMFMFALCMAIYKFIKLNYTWAALYLSLALFIKPVVVFLIFIWLIYFIYRAITVKKLAFIVTAIIPLSMLLVQILLNYTYTKTAIVSSMPAINLVQYNAYFTLCNTVGPDSANNWVRQTDSIGQIIEDKNNFRAAYFYKKTAAQNVIKAHPWAYIKIHSLGSMRWFIDPGRYDMLNFFNIYYEDGNKGWTRTFYQNGIKGILQKALDENRYLLICVLLIFMWNMIRLMLLIRGLLRLFNQPAILLVFVLLIAYFAGTAGPVASARFLLPVFPLILFCSAVAKPHQKRYK